MAGKGDRRRPRQVSREEYERRWERVFGGERGERIEELPAFYTLTPDVDVPGGDPADEEA